MELLPGPWLFSVTQTASQQIKRAAGGTSRRTAQLWNWNDTLTRELPSCILSWFKLSVQGVSSPVADNKLGLKDYLKQSVQAFPGFFFIQSNVRLGLGFDKIVCYYSKTICVWLRHLLRQLSYIRGFKQCILLLRPYIPVFLSSCLTNTIVLKSFFCVAEIMVAIFPTVSIKLNEN